MFFKYLFSMRLWIFSFCTLRGDPPQQFPSVDAAGFNDQKDFWMLGHFTPINIEKKALSNTFCKKLPKNAVFFPDIAFHESAKFSIL